MTFPVVPLLLGLSSHLILHLVEEVLEEALASRRSLGLSCPSQVMSVSSPLAVRPVMLSRTCGLARRKRLVRVATVLFLVDGAVDAADGAVEARLAEDLGSGQRLDGSGRADDERTVSMIRSSKAWMSRKTHTYGDMMREQFVGRYDAVRAG